MRILLLAATIAGSPFTLYAQNPQQTNVTSRPEVQQTLKPTAVSEPVYKFQRGMTPPRVVKSDASEKAEACSGRTGVAYIFVVISSSGEVLRAELVKSSDPQMGACAVADIRRNHYSPALKDKKPVAISMVIEQDARQK